MSPTPRVGDARAPTEADALNQPEETTAQTRRYGDVFGFRVLDNKTNTGVNFVP
jgi:hypothetical protein